MENFNLFFNIITIGGGIYCLYSLIKMKMAGKLIPNQLLVPKNAKPEDCLDEELYIQYISPRILVLGILLLLGGGIQMVVDHLDLAAKLFPAVENINLYVNEGCVALCLAGLVWYMVCWNKALKTFW